MARSIRCSALRATAQWAQQTPPGFVFAVKGGRYITHMLKLRNAQTALANFFASGLFELGDKLGPILWQFPPQMKFHAEVFEAFFRLLPRTTAAAATLARERDERLQGREIAGTRCRTGACATRWRCGTRASSTRRSSRCCAGTASPGWWPTRPRPWPLFEDVTADFVYMRLHGSTELYNSRYTADGTRSLGRLHSGLGRGRPAGGRAPDFARAAAARGRRATSTAISTTPTSCMRRTMRAS